MEFTPDAKRAFHLQTYGPSPVNQVFDVLDSHLHGHDGHDDD